MKDSEKPEAIISPAIAVDMLERCEAMTHTGPQWAHESDDLDLTLLTWPPDKRIAAHVNSEVDVVLIGVEGGGVVTIDGEEHSLRPGLAILIPKGCERAIAGDGKTPFSYLSVHRRRRGLMPTFRGKPVE